MLIGTNGVAFWLLTVSSRVTLDADGEIADPGADLTASGLISYYWDMLYISWFVQVTTLLSDWFWLAILVVRIAHFFF